MTPESRPTMSSEDAVWLDACANGLPYPDPLRTIDTLRAARILATYDALTEAHAALRELREAVKRVATAGARLMVTPGGRLKVRLPSDTHASEDWIMLDEATVAEGLTRWHKETK